MSEGVYFIQEILPFNLIGLALWTPLTPFYIEAVEGEEKRVLKIYWGGGGEGGGGGGT
jgi:hypothetical protein